MSFNARNIPDTLVAVDGIDDVLAEQQFQVLQLVSEVLAQFLTKQTKSTLASY